MAAPRQIEPDKVIRGINQGQQIPGINSSGPSCLESAIQGIRGTVYMLAVLMLQFIFLRAGGVEEILQGVGGVVMGEEQLWFLRQEG